MAVWSDNDSGTSSSKSFAAPPTNEEFLVLVASLSSSVTGATAATPKRAYLGRHSGGATPTDSAAHKFNSRSRAAPANSLVASYATAPTANTNRLVMLGGIARDDLAYTGYWQPPRPNAAPVAIDGEIIGLRQDATGATGEDTASTFAAGDARPGLAHRPHRRPTRRGLWHYAQHKGFLLAGGTQPGARGSNYVAYVPRPRFRPRVDWGVSFGGAGPPADEMESGTSVLAVANAATEALAEPGTSALASAHSGADALGDAGSSTLTAAHAGADALAEAQASILTALHAAAETLAEGGTNVHAAVHSALDALADAGASVLTVVHSGQDEAGNFETGTTVLAASHAGAEALTEAGVSQAIAVHAALAALAEAGASALVAIHGGAEQTGSFEAGTTVLAAAHAGGEALTESGASSALLAQLAAEALAETGGSVLAVFHAGAEAVGGEVVRATLVLSDGSPAAVLVVTDTSGATATVSDSPQAALALGDG